MIQSKIKTIGFFSLIVILFLLNAGCSDGGSSASEESETTTFTTLDLTGGWLLSFEDSSEFEFTFDVDGKIVDDSGFGVSLGQGQVLPDGDVIIDLNTSAGTPVRMEGVMNASRRSMSGVMAVVNQDDSSWTAEKLRLDNSIIF